MCNHPQLKSGWICLADVAHILAGIASHAQALDVTTSGDRNRAVAQVAPGMTIVS